MHSLKQIQQDFLDFLLAEHTSKNHPLVGHVLAQGKLDANTRLAIYGNAYKLRLKEVIETDHEILGIYLGDELFAQMFTGYVQQYPSKYDSLRNFCQHLPEFLRQQEPFSEHPILAELASFERLLLAAFDAADINRANSTSLAQIPAEQWPGMQVRFHPSMQLFTEQWNTVTSWQAIRAEQAPASAKRHNIKQNWLLWRNHERLTEFRSMPADEYYMINQYLSGAYFADICEGLLSWHSAEQVPLVAVQYLQTWLQQGLIHQLA